MENKENTVIEQEKTQQVEKTFTQDELNAIIDKRLSRAKAQFADYEELKTKAEQFDAYQEEQKTELEKATERANKLQAQIDEMKQADSIRAIREKVSSETGVPINLLNANTEEDCIAQAEAIKAFAKPQAVYPVVKDGGEAVTPTMSKEEILSIKDETARLKAIEQNIELFR